MPGFTSVNHRTHPLWTAVLIALPLAAAVTTGCIIRDDDDDRPACDIDWDGDCDCSDYGDCSDPSDPTPTPPNGTEAEIPIDTGATLQSVPGEGTGVFVEYLGNGEWDVWATCDTNFSGFTCPADIFVSAPGLLVDGGIDLEGNDVVEDDVDTFYASLNTDTDFDGVGFSAPEGAPVLIEVWLDGRLNGDFVFWGSQECTETGGVCQGLSTNPAWFVP